jgi:hypothetical protein
MARRAQCRSRRGTLNQVNRHIACRRRWQRLFRRFWSAMPRWEAGDMT